MIENRVKIMRMRLLEKINCACTRFDQAVRTRFSVLVEVPGVSKTKGSGPWELGDRNWGPWLTGTPLLE